MYAVDGVPAVARHLQQITASGATSSATVIVDSFAARLADGEAEGYVRSRARSPTIDHAIRTTGS